jgi:putative ABC transport system ATP-binding protein
MIKLEDVSKIYLFGKRKIVALSNIDLEVEEAEFLAIKGPSGAGKSTLLNIIAGLDTPTTGKVKVLDAEMETASEDFLSAFRSANLGFVFQNYNLISTFTALENVEFPLEISGKSFEQSARVAKTLLRRIGLEHRALHLPAQLSGGEQQRLAFARAIANDPPILLADEPTGNLDEVSEQKIVDILAGLKRHGKTIIASTHDENILRLADRIVSLKDGRISNAR